MLLSLSLPGNLFTESDSKRRNQRKYHEDKQNKVKPWSPSGTLYNSICNTWYQMKTLWILGTIKSEISTNATSARYPSLSESPPSRGTSSPLSNTASMTTSLGCSSRHLKTYMQNWWKRKVMIKETQKKITKWAGFWEIYRSVLFTSSYVAVLSSSPHHHLLLHDAHFLNHTHKLNSQVNIIRRFWSRRNFQKRCKQHFTLHHYHKRYKKASKKSLW